MNRTSSESRDESGMLPGDGMIGVVGLGAMGKPIAKCLLRAGYTVAVTWHKNHEPARELAEAGAVIYHPISDLAKACTAVITVLPGDAELTHVYGSEQGLLETLAAGSCCIDVTTATPATISRLKDTAEAAHIDLVDAPVSGGTRKAADGTLTAMVGAEANALRRVRPILDAFCARVYHTGDVGAGKAMKMVNQLMVAGNTYLACEALTLAGRSGLDPDLVREVVLRSSGTSWAFENAVSRSVLNGRVYGGGFPLQLMQKDLDIAARAAKESGLDLKVTDLLSRIFSAAGTPRRMEQDFPVLFEWLQEQQHQEQQQ